MVHQDSNVGLAFGLVIAAGAATALGASVVFFPSLVKLASRRVLAAALGMSGGVMLYTSFVDIFPKTIAYFEEDGNTSDIAFAYTTCCFFGGVLFMMITNRFIRWLSLLQPRCCRRTSRETKDSSNQVTEQCVEQALGLDDGDPVQDLQQWTDYLVETTNEDGTQMPSETEHSSAEVWDSSNHAPTTEQDIETGVVAASPSRSPNIETEKNAKKGSTSLSLKPQEQSNDEDKEESIRKEKEKRKLVHMGLNTAVAIGLHNFPEGLAAFLATLGDARVGAVFALAIAIHNVPEGLCVALPVYYGTGSRWKGFLWACLSGVSEPIGALLGYLILVNYFTATVFAILFGIVSGMMVYIVVKELLPTAHRYDPQDSVVTNWLIAGMAIMALSLVFFAISR